MYAKACSCSVCDAWCCCYCSYHRLVNLKYMTTAKQKTATPKRLAMEKSISVREVERQLDADTHLEEYQWWVPGRLLQGFLHQMFLHATATSQSEHDHVIHWGRREPSVEWDLRVESTMMELISPDSTRKETAELYWDVHQLWRLPSHCKEGRRSAFTRRSWIPSKNAPGISGHLQCWRQSKNGDQLTPTDPTPRLSLLLHTVPPMSSLLPCNTICAKKLWPSQGMHTSAALLEGKDTIYEPFPQPPVFSQLLVLWKLLMLEIPILGVVGEDPQVTPHCGDGHSPNQQEVHDLCHKEVPPSSDDSLEGDAGVDKDYQIPPLTW